MNDTEAPTLHGYFIDMMRKFPVGAVVPSVAQQVFVV